MHHALDGVFGQDVCQGVGFGQIDLVEGGPGIDRLGVAAKEVIDRHDAMSGLEQQFHGVGADIAGPPGNHDVHWIFLRAVAGARRSRPKRLC